MRQVLLAFWLISALLLIRERKNFRIIIYLAIFSLISSLCFLLFAAPDVAMAEAVVSVFSTVIFIVSFEKYYSLEAKPVKKKKIMALRDRVFPLFLAVFLFMLFIYFIPGNPANPYLKDQYLSMFSHDVGGENAVTSIYLGYRLYDTLFEALMLLVSITAIIHLSWHNDTFIPGNRQIVIHHSQIAVATIRFICPVLILFGVYLIVNGHISAGGGFQGGVIIASFFICRYLIYDINDMPIAKLIKLEKLAYALIVILAVFFIFLLADVHLPGHKIVYLVLMNLLIGMKVACSFLIIFYRFIVYERR